MEIDQLGVEAGTSAVSGKGQDSVHVGIGLMVEVEGSTKESAAQYPHQHGIREDEESEPRLTA